MSEITVKFTGRLLAIGELDPDDLPSGDVAVFSATDENLRAVGAVFRKQTTFHAGPLADSAAQLVSALKLAVARLARVDGGDSMVITTCIDALHAAGDDFDVEAFIAAEDESAAKENR